MNDALIANWNKSVNYADDVYFLGDFCMTKNPDIANRYLSILNGRKILIKGNHDKYSARANGWDYVSDIYDFWFNKSIHIVLCHYALRTWNRSCHGSWHLYGHSHGRLEQINAKCFDIGVDIWNYCPVPLEEIIKKMAILPNDNKL